MFMPFLEDSSIIYNPLRLGTTTYGWCRDVIRTAGRAFFNQPARGGLDVVEGTLRGLPA
jgi:hypothetical protein